ncbi:MAG TPA: nitronate monooxygenase family protein [Anaerovoracaceae bacterium]|nr:nitronate monooxygenase family protein [Anaerovoracaceae bacterium]
MKIPKLNIGGLIANIPIIQGGMGVGISGSRLAAAVANEGAVGIIAGVDIGYKEPDFLRNTLKANLRALKSEIRKARQLAPNGIIGLNLMVAMNNYEEMVRAAVQEGIDLIISGAGLPLNLPKLVMGSQTRIAPIVSSAKAARVITQYWNKRHGRLPDLMIVEGPEAGGHLGYTEEILASNNKPSVLDIVKEVIGQIPVIAAGGIYTGDDIADCLKAGANGVQMATRFVATKECDADPKFKDAYVNAKKEDIVIVESPVGMPGRVLKNKFIQKVTGRKEKITGCFQCLKGCNPKVAPYCISDALINAVKGNVDEGLIFVGSQVYRVDKITSVKKLIDELVHQCQNA